MTQNIIQVGNSAAVIIPKPLLKEIGVGVGDAIDLVAMKKPMKIEITPLRQKALRKTSGITPSFVKSVDEFIKQYRPVLEELAKR